MLLDHYKIAIVGLGYVGLPLAVEFGKQRSVQRFDINANRIAELHSGQYCKLKLSPKELTNTRKLSFSSNLEDLKVCKIFTGGALNAQANPL